MPRKLFKMGAVSAIVVVVAAAALTMLAPQAYAHVLQESNDMEALLHINPDDAPLAGRPTQLVFYFGSTNPAYHFNLNACQCEAALYEGDRLIAETAITPLPGAATVGHATLSFPQRNTYTVRVIAASQTPAFPAFELSYDVRVDQDAPAGQSSASVMVYSILALVLAAGAIILSLKEPWLAKKLAAKKGKSVNETP